MEETFPQKDSIFTCSIPLDKIDGRRSRKSNGIITLRLSSRIHRQNKFLVSRERPLESGNIHQANVGGAPQFRDEQLDDVPRIREPLDHQVPGAFYPVAIKEDRIHGRHLLSIKKTRRKKANQGSSDIRNLGLEEGHGFAKLRFTSRVLEERKSRYAATLKKGPGAIVAAMGGLEDSG